MFYQTYSGVERSVRTKRPASMLQRLGRPETEEEAEHLYEQMLRYANHWVAKVTFGTPTEHMLSVRTWSEGVQFYQDPGVWIKYNNHQYLVCPLTMLRRVDVTWLMYYTSGLAMYDRDWTSGSHYFYHTVEVGEEWNAAWCVRSPIKIIERMYDDTAQREERLLKFVQRHLFLREVKHLTEEAQAFREGLKAVRELDEKYHGHTGCTECGSLFVKKCGRCNTHCDHKTCRKIPRCRVCRKVRRCEQCGHCREHCSCAQAQFNINVNHNVQMGFPDVSKLAASFAGFRGDGVIRRFIIGLPVCCAQLWRGRSWPDYLLAVTALVNSLGLSSTIVNFVMDKFRRVYEVCTNLWKANDDPAKLLSALEKDESVFDKIWRMLTEQFGGRAQADTGFGSAGMMIGIVGGLITIVLAAIGMSRGAVDDKSLTIFMTRFGLLGRCVTSAEKVYEYGQKITDTIMKAFRVYALGQDPKLVVDYYEMHDWCDRVSALVNSDFEKNVKYNLTLKNKVDGLLREGDVIMKRMDGIKVPLVQRTRFTKLMDTLHRFRGMVAGSGAGCAELRPTPVIVHFCGDSGAGKSTVLWPLFMDVLARMGLSSFQHAKEAVYFRYAADDNKYWDGYHQGSKICVVDDIFTKKDSEASPNKEVDEVIRMANNAYWPLPMAHLEDKGTTHFNSPLVIWTSNRSQFSFPSRTNSEAIITRINLRYRVTPLPEFAEEILVGSRRVNRLMREKITAELKNNPENMRNFVQFQPLQTNADTDVILGPPITYDEMVEQVWGALQGTTERFSLMAEGLEDYFERVVKQLAMSQEHPVAQAQGFFETIRKMGLKYQVQTTVRDKAYPRKTWFGAYHYDPSEIAMARARTIRRLFMDNKLSGRWPGGLTDITIPSFPHCMCVTRALTEAEQDELCAMMVEHPEAEWQEQLCHLTFAPLLSTCGDDHRRSVVNFESIWPKIVEALLDKEATRVFEQRAASWVEEAEQLNTIGVLVSTFVITYLLVTTAMGAIGLVKKTCDVFSPTKAQQRLRAHSRAEQTAGRQVARVQLHSEACVKEYDEFATDFATRVMPDLERGVDAKLVAEKLNSVTDWRCECSGQVQSVMDQNAKEVGHLALGNLYRLDQELDGEWNPVMNIFVVQGRMAIANKHLRVILRNKDRKLRIVSGLRPVGYEFLCKDLRYTTSPREVDKDKDFLIIELPRRVHQHRNLVSKFVSEAEMARVSEYESICLVGYMVVGDVTLLRQSYAAGAMCHDRTIDLYDGTESVGRVRGTIKYNIPTAVGDCGSLVVSHDKRVAGKLAGIHAGGFEAEGSGFAQPVSQEMVRASIDGFSERFVDSKIASDPPGEDIPALLVGDLLFARRELEGEHMEVARAQVSTHRSFDTKIRPSILQGVICKPTTAPARLRKGIMDGQTVDPMDLARAKVKPRTTVLIDQYNLDRSISHYCPQIGGAMDVDRQVKSVKVAVEGVPGDDAYPALNRKSSAGYGWKSGNGKREYLGEVEYKITPEVSQRIDEGLRKVMRGERLNAVFIDTLKDERRDVDRVRKFKTRLFSAGEMIFTIIFRMFFLGWAAHMHRIRRQAESCVGINVFGSDWHALGQDLSQAGRGMVAGDFTNYDGTLPPEVLWGVLKVVEYHYQAEDQIVRARAALWSDVVNSWHLGGRVLYMWSQSNPSGCPVTSLLNSVAHSIMARYVYLRISETVMPLKSTLIHYDQYVRHYNYGDDDLWAIDSEESTWLNQASLTEGFKSLGMVYTDEQKTGEVRSMRRLEEVEFLKRSFRFEDLIARWVAPLRPSVILEMPQWIHQSSDPIRQTVETLETAWREACLHEEQMCYWLQMQLGQGVRLLQQQGRRVNTPPREEVLFALREEANSVTGVATREPFEDQSWFNMEGETPVLTHNIPNSVYNGTTRTN